MGTSPFHGLGIALVSSEVTCCLGLTSQADPWAGFSIGGQEEGQFSKEFYLPEAPSAPVRGGAVGLGHITLQKSKGLGYLMAR